MSEQVKTVPLGTCYIAAHLHHLPYKLSRHRVSTAGWVLFVILTAAAPTILAVRVDLASSGQ